MHGAANDLYTTSCAEYNGNNINRNKSVSLIVPAILIAATAIAAIAYFVYSNYGNRSDKTNINFGGNSFHRSVALCECERQPGTEYSSDGISERLINNLSQLPKLKIIAKSSSFKYKGKDADPGDSH